MESWARAQETEEQKQPQRRPQYRYKAQKPDKAEPVSPLLTVQMIFCMGVVLAVLAVRYFSPQLFGQLRSQYEQLLTSGISLTNSGELIRFAGLDLGGGLEQLQQALQQAVDRLTGPGPAAGDGANGPGNSTAAAPNGANGPKDPSAGPGSVPAAPAGPQEGDGGSPAAAGPNDPAAAPAPPPSDQPAGEAQALTGQGGQYEITHAAYLKTVTLAEYVLSDIPLMPVAGALTSPFGYRTHPITGNRDFHTGVDLAAPQGTPAAAAWAGVVAETGYNDISGNYVKVIHSGQICTCYLHLSQITVTVGQRISRGEAVGLVGSTGVSTGPHLHFELLINGVRVDPARALGL